MSRSPDDIGGLQAAVLENADALHRLWRNPGFFSDSAPDFAALHPGYADHGHDETGSTGPLFAPYFRR